VGNCIVLSVLVTNSQATSPKQTCQPSSVTDNKGFITWIEAGAWIHNTSPPNQAGSGIWIGIVGTGGTVSTTVTVHWSPAIGTGGAQATEIVLHELHNSVSGQTWSIDGSAVSLQVTTSSTTVTMPTVPTTVTGEIYYGYGNVTNTASTSGQTSGYTAFSTTTNGNLVLYNFNVTTTGNQSPIAKQSSSGASAMIACIIQVGIPAQTIVLDEATVTTTAYVLAVLKQLLLSKATSLTTTAYVLSVLKQYLLAAATELTCTAYALTYVTSGVTVVLNAATELVTTAYAMTVQKTHPLSIAVQVVTSAYSIGISKLHPLPVATQVDCTAYPLQSSKTYPLAKPSATVTAYGLTVYKRQTLSGPSVETTAYPIQFSTPASILLDSPTCETTAYPLTFQKLTFPWVLNWWFKPRGKTIPWYSERKDSEGQEAG
jgi:hypothetical protein